MNVEVDGALCMSYGMCIASFPAAFSYDEDDHAVVSEGAGGLSDGELREAAQNCPAGAIRLT